MNFARIALAALFALAMSPAAHRPHAGQDNRPPSVKLKSPTKLLLEGACGVGEPLNHSCTPMAVESVAVSGVGNDPDGDALRYTFKTTGGRLSGTGQNVTLDLRGLAPGHYTITVMVEDGRGGVASDSAQLEVVRCNCPASVSIPDPPCPTVNVSCPSEPVTPGTPITFNVNVSGGDPNITPTYNWTVSAGTITGGQGTASIAVVAQEVLARGGSLTATVEVGGYDRSCSTSSSCTVPPGATPPSPRRP